MVQARVDPLVPARGRAFHDLTALGVGVLVLWLLLVTAWLRRGRPDQLLWLCDMATLGTAIGLLLRNRLLITAEFVGILWYHLAWQIDLVSFLATGRMPLDATAYMFVDDLSRTEKALSLVQHTFLIPVTVWGIARLGADKRGWLLQTGQTSVLLVLSYFVANPAHNVNWIFGSGLPRFSPQFLGSAIYYLALAAGPPLLLYWPAQAIALRLGRAASGVRLTKPIRPAVASLGCLMLLGLAVAGTWQIPQVVPQSLLVATMTGATQLEELPVDPSVLQVSSITFDSAGRPVELPLVEFARARTTDGDTLLPPRPLERILEDVPLATIPWAPTFVMIRGVRVKPGTTIAAVVLSDRFYPQPAVDWATSTATFRVAAQLGDPGTDEHRPPGDSTAGAVARFANDGPGRRFAIAVIATSRAGPVARTPFLLFRRGDRWAPIHRDSSGSRPSAGAEPKSGKKPLRAAPAALGR